MFTLPDLPYAYDALEPYIDKATMKVHHDGHHATYVKNLNDLVKEEKSLEELINDPNPKIKNNAGGVLNHNFFWEIMSPSSAKPSGSLAEAINKSFGSLDEFIKQFSDKAIAHFGSGWAWLVANNSQLEIIDTNNQDSPLSLGKKPVIGLDVWEHAYYLKYQNKRAEYVKNWWNVVNWAKVEENYLASIR